MGVRKKVRLGLNEVKGKNFTLHFLLLLFARYSGLFL